MKDYKDYNQLLNAHLAVALKSGEVYVFEVKCNQDKDSAELLELYHKGGFGEIVDIEYKFGHGTNPSYPGLY